MVLCACTSGHYPPSALSTISSPELTRPLPTFVSTALHCTDYVETKWGTGWGEWGFYTNSKIACSNWEPPSLRLSPQGDVYILDPTNQRLLRYVGTIAPQVISIPIGDLFELYGAAFSHCNCPSILKLRLGVGRDRLFLLFHTWQNNRWVDQLAALSPEGRVEHIVDLGWYYPLRAYYAPIPDTQGGVYLIFPPAGVVYFNADLRPEFKYMGGDDPQGYDKLTVGWDGNIYTYKVSGDVLFNWGSDHQLFMLGEPLHRQDKVITPVISHTVWVSFLGADARGQLYFDVQEGGQNYRYIRISGNHIVIAPVPPAVGMLPVLAPDGSVYSVVYDSTDFSVNPKIIKCVFDED